MSRKKWYDVTVRFTVQAKYVKDAEEDAEGVAESWGVLREMKRTEGVES